MKNLANCTPREFLKQTSKIRHAVEQWLKLTEILEIRKRLPKIEAADNAERVKAMQDAARANFALILDSIMDKHPDETAELLGLLCFVEPEDVDNHPMSEYMGAVSEMISNEDVLRFFISLVRLAQTLGLTA